MGEEVTVVIDDCGHVGAPVWLVWRRLTDIPAWPTWWPGVAMAHDGPPWMVDARLPGWGRLPGPGRLSGRRSLAPARGSRRLRVALEPHGWRHEHSFHARVDGDVVGSTEWWLEATAHGTLVHHVASVAPGLVADGPVRWRAVVRHGLWGLADVLSREVRDAVGLPDDPQGRTGPSL